MHGQYAAKHFPELASLTRKGRPSGKKGIGETLIQTMKSRPKILRTCSTKAGIRRNNGPTLQNKGLDSAVHICCFKGRYNFHVLVMQEVLRIDSIN